MTTPPPQSFQQSERKTVAAYSHRLDCCDHMLASFRGCFFFFNETFCRLTYVRVESVFKRCRSSASSCSLHLFSTVFHSLPPPPLLLDLFSSFWCSCSRHPHTPTLSTTAPRCSSCLCRAAWASLHHPVFAGSPASAPLRSPLVTVLVSGPPAAHSNRSPHPRNESFMI